MCFFSGFFCKYTQKPTFVVLYIAKISFNQILVEKCVKMGFEHILRNISKSRQMLDVRSEARSALDTPNLDHICTLEVSRGYRGIFEIKISVIHCLWYYTILIFLPKKWKICNFY